jgi:uncharacterized protein YbjT (DUF2867 family)
MSTPRSSSPLFLVTAASGRIGARVARGLLDDGARVRVVSRNAANIADLVARGAEAAIGDLRDTAFARSAFAGSDTAFLVVRTERTSRDFRREFGDVGRAMADAMRANGTRRAVFLSALGAHDDRHRGLILVHRDVELALAETSGAELAFVRAPFFAENLLYFLDTMRSRGGLFTPIDPDVGIDVASTPEIAALALRVVRDFTPGAHELRSPAPVTLRAIGHAIELQLGRAFPVGRTTRDDDVVRMMASGASTDFAHLMNDAWDTYSRAGRVGDPAQLPHAIAMTTASTDDLARTIVLPRLA